MGGLACSRGEDGQRRALKLLSGQGLEGAKIVVDMALQGNKDSGEAWGARADLLYLQKDYASSLASANRSLDLDPENALVWNTRGNALYMLERYDEALDCYNRAIELDPLLARAWYNKRLALDAQLKRSKPRISRVG